MTRLPRSFRLALAAALAAACVTVQTAARAADPWLTLKGQGGPGQGKHVVLVSGDEEYRSEEARPSSPRSWRNTTGSTAPCSSRSMTTASSPPPAPTTSPAWRRSRRPT